MQYKILGQSVESVYNKGVNKSGTITTGGAAQTLAAANTSRLAILGQNVSGDDLWVNQFGGTAAPGAAGSNKIPSGATFEIYGVSAVSVYGATTSQAFTAVEYVR